MMLAVGLIEGKNYFFPQKVEFKNVYLTTFSAKKGSPRILYASYAGINSVITIASDKKEAQEFVMEDMKKMYSPEDGWGDYTIVTDKVRKELLANIRKE